MMPMLEDHELVDRFHQALAYRLKQRSEHLQSSVWAPRTDLIHVHLRRHFHDLLTHQTTSFVNGSNTSAQSKSNKRRSNTRAAQSTVAKSSRDSTGNHDVNRFQLQDLKQHNGNGTQLILQQTLLLVMHQVRQGLLEVQGQQELKQEQKSSEPLTMMPMMTATTTTTRSDSGTTIPIRTNATSTTNQWQAIASHERDYYNNRRTKDQELWHMFRQIQQAHTTQYRQGFCEKDYMRSQDLLTRLNQMDEQVALETTGDALKNVSRSGKLENEKADEETQEHDDLSDDELGPMEAEVTPSRATKGKLSKNSHGEKMRKKVMKKKKKQKLLKSGLTPFPLLGGRFLIHKS